MAADISKEKHLYPSVKYAINNKTLKSKTKYKFTANCKHFYYPLPLQEC